MRRRQNSRRWEGESSHLGCITRWILVDIGPQPRYLYMHTHNFFRQALTHLKTEGGKDIYTHLLLVFFSVFFFFLDIISIKAMADSHRHVYEPGVWSMETWEHFGHNYVQDWWRTGFRVFLVSKKKKKRENEIIFNGASLYLRTLLFLRSFLI